MVQQTPTKLSLSEFARIMGIHPLHFWGVQYSNADGSITTQSTSCQSTYFQHEYQNAAAASREEIARCIARAETDIEHYLGYRLLPDWEADEWHAYPRPFKPELLNLGSRNAAGFPLAVRASWGHVISGGVRASTLLHAAAAITWTDADQDGYDEMGTVSFATTITNDQEIQLFYPGHGGDPAYRIRPVTVTTLSGIATCTFRRELCVKENLIEAFQPEAVDGDDAANFLSTVDAYRVYNDPSVQATFLWEGGCGCGSDGCASCSYSTQTGCLLVRDDPKYGLVVPQPATWDADLAAYQFSAWSQGRAPDAIRLYYRAGLRDKSGARPYVDMDRDWARTVAYFAASMLERPPCGCNSEMWDRWREDLAFVDGAEELASYILSANDLENPFGTRRGAIYAWKRVSRPDAGVGVGAVLA